MSPYNNMMSITISDNFAPFFIDPGPVHRPVNHPGARVLLLAFLADPRRYVVVRAFHFLVSGLKTDPQLRH